MEIIKRGTLPAERTYMGTCSYCKSVVRAMHDELTHTDSQRDGRFSSSVCPVCLSKMYFSQEEPIQNIGNGLYYPPNVR